MSHQRFICDQSGFDFPISEAVRAWDGALVHRRFRDTRNPQDFVKAVRESIPAVSRPEPTDVFVAIGEITQESL
mgnify:CR=1 FL=1